VISVSILAPTALYSTRAFGARPQRLRRLGLRRLHSPPSHTFWIGLCPQINGFEGLIVEHLYVKSRDPRCIGYCDIVPTNRQTNSGENLTLATAVGMSNCLRTVYRGRDQSSLLYACELGIGPDLLGLKPQFTSRGITTMVGSYSQCFITLDDKQLLSSFLLPGLSHNDYRQSKQQLRTDAATTRFPDQSRQDRARIYPYGWVSHCLSSKTLTYLSKK